MQPYALRIADTDIADLQRRLRSTRWPEESPYPAWEEGVPVAFLRDLAQHWAEGYDWRRSEARLNRWPQWVAEVDGQRVHFAHLRSPVQGAAPVMMIHGWPGSIVEFARIVSLLTDPARSGLDPAGAAHLVLPSIPGFGLAGPTREPGWDGARAGRALAFLMAELGYDRYFLQGGDWGAAIAREIALAFPERVIGVHLNLIPGAAQERELTDAEQELPDRNERVRSYAAFRRWMDTESGYAMLQSTRPQTLSYGLTDSPVAQLAWIVEKFRAWSDPASELIAPHRWEELLTNVSLYWFTRTGGSSARAYFERARCRRSSGYVQTPTALAAFPHENFIPVRAIAEQRNNIVRWTPMPRGGHFAALETPDLLAADINAFLMQLHSPGAGP